MGGIFLNSASPFFGGAEKNPELCNYSLKPFFRYKGGMTMVREGGDCSPALAGGARVGGRTCLAMTYSK
jgi:hypothetical protein